MVVMFIIFGVGIILMVVGYYTSNEQPYVNPPSSFPTTFTLPSGEIINATIQFTGNAGLMPGRGITAALALEVPENSSIIQVKFPQALTSSPHDQYPAQEGKPITLEHPRYFSGNYTQYSGEADLIYLHEGTFDSVIIVKNNGHAENKTLNGVVTIGSWSDYLREKSDNTTKGFTDIIIGLTLISTSPIFIKAVDLARRSDQLRNAAQE